MAIAHQQKSKMPLELHTRSVAGALDGLTIWYEHGLYGSKDGELAKLTESVAVDNRVNFAAYDNLAHGKNLSVPLMDADMDDWIQTSKQAIAQTTPHDDLILVGNSWGLHQLIEATATASSKNKIVGVIGIGGIIDSIPREMRHVLGLYFQPGIFQDGPILGAETKAKFDAGQTIMAPYPTPDSDFKVPVSKSFYEAASRHTLLTAEGKFSIDYKFDCQVHLIRGEDDQIVTLERNLELAGAFRDSGAQVFENTVKDAGHDLKGDAAKDSIQLALQKVISQYKKHHAIG